jgi:hypothetical protein
MTDRLTVVHTPLRRHRAVCRRPRSPSRTWHGVAPAAGRRSGRSAPRGESWPAPLVVFKKRPYAILTSSHSANMGTMSGSVRGENRFGPNESAVMQLISQAATMDFDQISRADTILSEMNGPSGLRKPWRDAQLGLSRIKSFRQEPADQASRAGAGAVMRAVATIAKDQESSAAILANWDLCKEDKVTLFRAFVRTPRAERVLQGHLVESFGRDGPEVVIGARWAVSTAAEVLVVWDLARVNGPFTLAHRDFLMRPWLSVFHLPNGL